MRRGERGARQKSYDDERYAMRRCEASGGMHGALILLSSRGVIRAQRHRDGRLCFSTRRDGADAE